MRTMKNKLTFSIITSIIIILLLEASNVYAVGALLDSMKYEQGRVILHLVTSIIAFCRAQMFALGLTAEEIILAMAAVCESNDSKQAILTPSNIKANINKGAAYFPPTAKLKQILSVVEDRFNEQN